MWAFRNLADTRSMSNYYLPKIMKKNYNIMTNKISFFNQLVKNKKISENIIEIIDYNDVLACCLLDFPYFKRRYKIIATDLRKQKVFNGDHKKIRKINFIVTPDTDTVATLFLLLKILRRSAGHPK